LNWFFRLKYMTKGKKTVTVEGIINQITPENYVIELMPGVEVWQYKVA
jgi:hypothetical protein